MIAEELHEGWHCKSIFGNMFEHQLVSSIGSSFGDGEGGAVRDTRRGKN